jgi:hypothetical protein
MAAKTLSIKVLIRLTGSTKTFLFPDTTLVQDVMEDIRSKGNLQVETSDHGLFVPFNSKTGKNAYWLDKHKMLKSFDVSQVRRPVLLFFLTK